MGAVTPQRPSQETLLLPAALLFAVIQPNLTEVFFKWHGWEQDLVGLHMQTGMWDSFMFLYEKERQVANYCAADQNLLPVFKGFTSLTEVSTFLLGCPRTG